MVPQACLWCLRLFSCLVGCKVILLSHPTIVEVVLWLSWGCYNKLRYKITNNTSLQLPHCWSKKKSDQIFFWFKQIFIQKIFGSKSVFRPKHCLSKNNFLENFLEIFLKLSGSAKTVIFLICTNVA